MPTAKKAALKAEVVQKLAAVDPVVFARELLGFAPDPWQAEFLRSGAQRIILNCSRQSGKSTTTAVLALWEAIYKPKSVIILDSPSLRQSQELMGKFTEFLGMLQEKVRLDSDTKLSVRFGNGSRVLALPGSEKTIRGISAVTLFIEDEAARVPDELYKSIRPMLAVSNGRLILMSTPYGPTGHFYETWRSWEEQGPASGWQGHQVLATDCPRIPASFLEEEKRALGGVWFAQEYCCEFVAADATRMKREWLRYVDRTPGNLDICLGIDLAISEKASADYTAGVVLGRDGRGDLFVLDVHRFRGSFQAQIDFIKQLAAKWNPRIVAIEDVAYQRAMVQKIAAETNLTVKGVKPDKDKVSRFAPLEGRYESGQVWHVRGLPVEFEQELLSFPVGDHDDQVDAMSTAFAGLGIQPVQISIPTQAIRGRGFSQR